jgi:hypothetical protein
MGSSSCGWEESGDRIDAGMRDYSVLPGLHDAILIEDHGDGMQQKDGLTALGAPIAESLEETSPATRFLSNSVWQCASLHPRRDSFISCFTCLLWQ